MKNACHQPARPQPLWNDIFKNKKWGTYPSEAVVREVMSLDKHQGIALDLGCGAGANAVFLAENGYKVDAVDASREALHQAEVLSLKRGVHERINLIEGNYLTGGLQELRYEYDLTLDWLSLAHQKKDTISNEMNYYLSRIGKGCTYIVGLFGSETSSAALDGVPTPSFFTKAEVRARINAGWKCEEVSYTRNGNRVQVWCLVFTRE